MAEFEQLQELWQRQDAPPAPAADVERLTDSLRAYGRRQYAIHVAKAILVAAVLAWSLSYARPSARVLAGYGLIAIAALMVLMHPRRRPQRGACLPLPEHQRGA